MTAGIDFGLPLISVEVPHEAIAGQQSVGFVHGRSVLAGLSGDSCCIVE